MAVDKKEDSKKVYLLNNKAKRVIRINGVRLFVGINKITEDQFKKLTSSMYFEPYFHGGEEDGDELAWVKGFSPDKHNSVEIVALPLNEAKKIIKEVLDINFLNQLEIDCKDADLKAAILKQKKEVLPSEKELK